MGYKLCFVSPELENRDWDIETYTKIEAFTRDKDIVTNSKIKEILKDEQEHLSELYDLRKDITGY